MNSKNQILIIIDTLARCLGEAEENLAKDMGAFIAGCYKLKGETNTSILIVHHTGKDESRGARGSSVLTASLDCEFYISRDGKNSNNQFLIFECTKMKDMEPSSRKAYILKHIDLYYDQEDELVSSLTDFPSARVGEKVAIFEDNLESFLLENWLEWSKVCNDVESVTGISLTKNQLAYRTATLKANGEVPKMLRQILTKVEGK